MIHLILIVFSFLFMEFVAWSNHKYVMHGFLWRWHKDHHIHDKVDPEKLITHQGRWEKNDRFFLVYAIPAIILIISGLSYEVNEMISIGVGISLYGLTYFTIHDVIIHHRLKIPLIQRNHGKYMRSLLRAHAAHHWAKTSKDFRNFGLLIFPLRFFNE